MKDKLKVKVRLELDFELDKSKLEETLIKEGYKYGEEEINDLLIDAFESFGVKEETKIKFAVFNYADNMNKDMEDYGITLDVNKVHVKEIKE